MATAEDLLRLWAERSPDESAQWGSLEPGPAVTAVASRLSTVPRQFLEDGVVVGALAGDVLGSAAAGLAAASIEDASVRQGAAIALWLFASEALLGAFEPPLLRDRPALAVDALAMRVAPVAAPSSWIADAERREEAARSFLLWNGQLPAGEDVAQARASLAARDSLQFNRALAESIEEHRHRQELARRLSEARAREATARYTRE